MSDKSIKHRRLLRSYPWFVRGGAVWETPYFGVSSHWLSNGVYFFLIRSRIIGRIHWIKRMFLDRFFPLNDGEDIPIRWLDLQFRGPFLITRRLIPYE